MFSMKHCRKRKGGLYLDKDHYGFLSVCLQRGFYQDLVSPADVLKKAA